MRGDANILDICPGVALIDETYLLWRVRLVFLYQPVNNKSNGGENRSGRLASRGNHFVFSAFGVWFENRFGERYRSKAELTGGIILIIMGTKILLEHLGALG